MVDQCPICRRPRSSKLEFCNLHATAANNLNKGFEIWNAAFGGDLTQQEYLDRVGSLPETGEAVKRVIDHLRGTSVKRE